ncbi:glycosyltransferase family 10 domain-containing protein [Alistipes sp.]|uniref:glycosyltransferase family 10 domain-containing protein n=1 Tax=Alistipes sp. TaxID=1872444 RepID=UPI003AF1890F
MIHPIDITRNLIDLYRRTNRSLACSKPYHTKLYNWPAHIYDQDLWLSRFIELSEVLKKKPKAKIGLYSVFGPRWIIDYTKADIKLFLSRENLHRINWRHYADQCIGYPGIDLTIGFDYPENQSGTVHPNYIRVPLWIMWVFSPDDNFRTVRQKIAAIEAPENKSFDDRKFCSFLSSHFDIGRDKIVEQISSIERIDCDGKLFHNNDDLKTLYNDDKLEYLRHYRFNLCPENSNYAGYCTEKIFEAISSGCIPIYNGSDNRPEPDVLNPEAICFFDFENANERTLSLVADLNSNRNQYLEFANQPRFVPGAEEIIWGYFELLRARTDELLKNI